DPGLLDRLRRDLLAGARDNPGFLHHFAKPALAFDAPRTPWLAGLFGRGSSPSIDLKKAALFPIVHGARTLALEAGLDVLHTADRLEALAARRTLDPGLARDAVDAFFFVSAMRLDAAITADDLTEARRAKLDVCLATVKRFKEELARRFRLDR
ncbi:MAG TPA: putative nucleotidyltransferase substrate binding domain-containing protein, partial [Azospirillaceae bacterium]|nr:putative nucleotidyltransferase substrate binding domain-containing protein [Azospirillaceae bacterium]